MVDYGSSAKGNRGPAVLAKASSTASRRGERPRWSQPALQQHGREMQAFGSIVRMPIALEEDTCRRSVEVLNQILADTLVLRDLYKKHHWQVAGPTFIALHELFDAHFQQQLELIDALAERVQMLGGISVAMAADVVEMTQIPRPPRGREEVPVQMARLLEAHEIILRSAHEGAALAAKNGDDGTNDLLVSGVIRTHEQQVWFLTQHLIEMPLVHAESDQKE